MNTLNKVLAILSLSICAFAQVAPTQTTITAALTGGGTASPGRTVCLTSSTGVSAPGFNNPALTGIMVGKEFMIVNASTPSSLCWSVTRGYAGTAVAAHAANEVAWVGPTGGFTNSPFINNPPAGGPGGSCTVANDTYSAYIVVGGEGYQTQIGSIWSCPTTGPNANVWQYVILSNNGASDRIYNVLDVGANNAIAATFVGLPQTQGVNVAVKLAHTLQAGANTFALNGATAVAIKSSRNVANNIGTLYAATGTINLQFDGTEWVDISQ